VKLIAEKDGLVRLLGEPLFLEDFGNENVAFVIFALGHFAAAIERGQLWWAAGQPEQLRHSCVRRIRIEQGVEVGDEPYWKLASHPSAGDPPGQDRRLQSVATHRLPATQRG
jgi:hypothetical protein